MSQRLAVALLAVLALAGCGHSRSEQQARTGTRSVTTRATPTVTTTVPTTGGTAPLPTTVPKPKPARRLLVGAVEDEAKFAPTDAAARADMARAKDAGFRAIAFSAFWRPPLRQLKPIERDALRRAARTAVAASITPIVDVAQFGRDTPLTEAEREEFASFAASVPRLVPEVEHVVVGNEPNTDFFWRPQFDASGATRPARAYERLLAQSYDAIKAVAPHVEVIGGALAPRGADRPHGKRPTHSPTAFIRDLGAATAPAAVRARSWTRSRCTSTARRSRPADAGAPVGHDDRDRRLRQARALASRGARPHDAQSCTASTASTRRFPPRELGRTRAPRSRRPRRSRNAGSVLLTGDRARRLPAARRDAPLLPRHGRAAARELPDRHVLRRPHAEARARAGRAAPPSRRRRDVPCPRR